MRALSHLDDSWHLVLVGDGPARTDIEAEMHALGLAGRVHLVGSRDVNVHTYRAFDVFALSSISEAMPMTVLEAFAARVPVVASAVGGLPALLQGGRTGSLYPSGDAGALASAVQETMRDLIRTAVSVEAAHAQLLASHTVGAMATAYEALYAEAIEIGQKSRRTRVS